MSRAMPHDESEYPEPLAFKAERFFDKNEELNDDDRILTYGFGWRYLPPFTVQIHSYKQTEFASDSAMQAQLPR